MVTYEYARLSDGRFVAYCNDTIYNVKMVVYGTSHSKICLNFARLLKYKGITRSINTGRFIQAMESNPELIDKFGNGKRGYIINKNEVPNIVSVKEKREIAKVEQKERNQLADELIKQNELEKSFDQFMTKIDDEGNICIYGIKLIKKYKNNIPNSSDNGE